MVPRKFCRGQRGRCPVDILLGISTRFFFFWYRENFAEGEEGVALQGGILLVQRYDGAYALDAVRGHIISV